jgi:hypothetical protein
LEDRLRSLRSDEREELGNPCSALFDVARNFLIDARVGGRFRSASFDHDGGILLDFTENLVIGLSFHKAFFPSLNYQPIEKYYLESELEEMIEKFF